MNPIQMVWSLHFQTYFISKKSPKVQRADGGRADDDEVNSSSRSWNNKQETIILYERITTVKSRTPREDNSKNIVQNWGPCKTFAIFDEARGEQRNETEQSFLL